MPNNLTDTEIKKVLECCIKGTACNECPLFDVDGCMEHLVVCLNDLINRQDFKIHQLEKQVKEFADKLEEAFSKTESQIPNSEVIKQTVQICRNAIQLVSNRLAGE